MSSRPHHYWTPEMDGALAQLYLSDMAHLDDIAVALGVTWSAVKNRAHVLGLRRNPTWTPRGRAVHVSFRVRCLSCDRGFFSADPRTIKVCGNCKKRPDWGRYAHQVTTEG